MAPGKGMVKGELEQLNPLRYWQLGTYRLHMGLPIIMALP